MNMPAGFLDSVIADLLVQHEEHQRNHPTAAFIREYVRRIPDMVAERKRRFDEVFGPLEDER